VIGPVSGTGRAMMASLQQAIDKGMPPDQAIQYVKSMATQGVAPLTDLYAMMSQFQRLKQKPTQAPQTPPTIKDQLNMMEQMQNQQAQMAAQAQVPQGNIQQMQAPAPAGQPMDRGLGAIDAGRMEYPKFAGGGMVALAGGGEVDDDVVKMANGTPRYMFNDDLQAQVPAFMRGDMDIISFVKAQMPNFDTLPMADKQMVLKQFEPLYMQARAARSTLESRGALAEEAAAPVPPAFTARNPFAEGEDVDAALAQEFSRLATRTGGEETKPKAEKKAEAAPRAEAKPKGDVFSQYELEAPDLAKIKAEREARQKATKTGAYSQADADLAAYIKEQKDRGGDEKQAYRDFWVRTGAALMASKSPYFLSALGESVQSNYGGLVKDLKTLKDDTKALRLQEIQLRQAQERAMESGSQADQDRFDALSDRARNTNFKILEARVGIQQKVLDRQHDVTLAQLRQYGNDKAATELNRLWKEAMGESDPAKKEQMLAYYEQYREAVRQNTLASTAGGVAAEIRAGTSADTRIAKLADNMQYRRLQNRAANADITTEEGRQDKANAERMMRLMEEQARGSVGAGPRVTQDQGLTGGAYTGPYSTSGW